MKREMMEEKRITKPVLIIVGPTAIGKTELSLELAERYNCEIISADSMQVYRYMDIGTAKVSPEERGRVRHHLIDIVNPDENYDAAKFASDCLEAITDIHKRGKTPLITGGTGLYIKALLYGIFPDAPSDASIRKKLQGRLKSEGCSKLHEELSLCDSISAIKIHKNDTQRLLRALEVYYITGKPWSEHLAAHKTQGNHTRLTNLLQIALTCQRNLLYERINLRTETMIQSGLEGEVRKLLSMGYKPELKAMGAIGYKHMVNCISGIWSEEKMIELLARDTRRYAKRQYTWFSKIDDLQWIDISEKDKIIPLINRWLPPQNQQRTSP